ncbi:MAG: NAD(+) synthase [Deltaproteobacteria bacterium]|nr:NAD(+) synthase [Deltaproteobacteria bacterium]
MGQDNNFFNLYSHGFVRLAVCVPPVRIAEPLYNAQMTLSLAKQAQAGAAVFAVFPELGISAYSNEDLFQQEVLLQSSLNALEWLVKETKKLKLAIAVGVPLRVANRLFNCGVVICQGKIHGVAVKSYLPNYREFYEARQFSPAFQATSKTITLCGQEEIPFGNDLLFQATDIPHCSIYLEICEDLWVPVPPSSFACLAGATIVGNLSASNITIGKADYRHALASTHSARCLCAYLYAAAGFGESTTDLAWDGQSLIYENGTMLAASQRFSAKAEIVFGDVDLDRLAQDRLRMGTFGENTREHSAIVSRFRRINIPLQGVKKKRLLLNRDLPRFVYIPAKESAREQTCFEAYNIQVNGLAQRIQSSGLKNAIIGVSGGIDSTHALLVVARTMDTLGLSRKNIKGYTLPGFATTARTYSNSLRLMQALGVEANEIDIKPSCLQMMKDIGHPYATGEKLYDLSFENIQAGERTSHLFRLANFHQGMVIGTGDLSELALGWCTYGVGDHMAHYALNACVPKTLISYLIRWVADAQLFSSTVSAVLYDILATEISPELIPGDDNNEPAQKTEAIIGPYELQDFNMYYITRFGYLPSKVAFMAYNAWHDKNRGIWLADVPQEEQHEYTIGEIKKWLGVFLFRFFQTSQYKRSCIPNSPKVGSGGSLSPRGDYRAPSDATATIWLENLKQVPEEE